VGDQSGWKVDWKPGFSNMLLVEYPLAFRVKNTGKKTTPFARLRWQKEVRSERTAMKGYHRWSNLWDESDR